MDPWESESGDRVDALVAGSEIFTKKWNPAIVGLLTWEGPQGFSDLEDRLEISAKVLSDSLDDLQEHGIVERRVLSESPLRVEYDLTPHGEALGPVVDELANWARSNVSREEPTVLVADGDPRVAEMHAEWIAERYETATASSGGEAVAVADESVDVVVVDRRLSTDRGAITDVLAAETDAPVLVVSSVDPDFDLVDRQCDAYLQKPTDGSTLVEEINRLLARRDLEPRVREYLSLRARRDALESATAVHQRERSDAYDRLTARIDTLRERIDDDRLAELSATAAIDAT